MLLLSVPMTDHGVPRTPRRRGRGSIVWQPHYEGFTTTAYQSGKAIAGISGPWSNQYVLIWWEHAQPIRQVELFDSLDEAKQAVAERLAAQQGTRVNELLATFRSAPTMEPRQGWFKRVRQWLLPGVGNNRNPAVSVVDHRRRRPVEETDLRGLNLRALR